MSFLLQSAPARPGSFTVKRKEPRSCSLWFATNVTVTSVVGISRQGDPITCVREFKNLTESSADSHSKSQVYFCVQYFEKNAGDQRDESTLNTATPSRPRLRVIPSPIW